MFVVMVIFAFKSMCSRPTSGAVRGATQTCSIRCCATMLVTVFVFLGIEGASIIRASRRSAPTWARHRHRLPRGARLLVSCHAAYAVLHRRDRRDSAAVGGTVLEAVVGHWGAVFIGVGLIVSVLAPIWPGPDGAEVL